MIFERLDRRVRFKKPATEQNPYGDPVPVWQNLDAADSAVGEVWAEVIYKGSPKENPQAYQIFPDRVLTFIIRDPRTSWTLKDSYHVEYEGEEYNVIGFTEIGRREGYRVFCDQINQG